LGYLQHVEATFPQYPYLSMQLAKTGWFVEDFGDAAANDELSRMKRVAAEWGAASA
jgi:hypothetical protein